ncbi:proteasome regulatory particle base subunit [Yamadazyma tenuis]|uniref:proteasome regulatory particle base subunit n=1 Tax=Candida tenuis TaxID=2315449 RepID=UPI0027AB8546|nr:proteasome regulatory particle base subunit [Yamadazyma tenuis]
MAPVKDENPDHVEKTKKKAHEEEELNEEDQHLKDELEMLVEKLNEPSHSEAEYVEYLDSLKSFIENSTTSLTAVPKPLKFLRPHYSLLCSVYESWSSKPSNLQDKFADVLSVLAMTYSDDGNNESLKYRLLCKHSIITDWGHEYMRHLALEIGSSYQESLGNDEEYVAKVVKLSTVIVQYFLKHNAEADAVDLLLEIEGIEKLPQYVDESTFQRVCLYMVSCVPYLSPPDDATFLQTAYSIYVTHNQLTQALALAIKLDDEELISQVFKSTEDVLVHKQLGLILSQQNNGFKYPGDDEQVQECIANVKLNDYFSYLVKELNLLDARVPEDVYKSHLETSKAGIGNSGSIDSAKQNLAASFVNMFLNLGFGNDKLVQTDEDNKSWIYKTKGPGMSSTTASLGAIHQWNVNDGLQILDKYTYSQQDEVKAGALLGTGIISANVHDDVDASLALLQDYVVDPSSSKVLQTSAINGLGIAFAGTANEEVLALLLPLVSDLDISVEVSSLSALALGHVFVGTCNGDITSTILQTLLERDFTQLTNKFITLMALGLGLLYMGKTEQVEDVLGTIDAIEHPISKTLKVLVNICAYAGTGNVLQIQSLLQMCTSRPKEETDVSGEDENEAEADATAPVANSTTANIDEGNTEDVAMEDASPKPEKSEAVADDEADEEDDLDQDEEDVMYHGFAVLGLALIAMGEDIGQDMSLRHFSHLMHYGNSLIRRAVPLAMALTSTANPQMKVFETLSRYSHDPDLEVAQNAIYAMGLVGTGTNNARLAQLLRQLASYYIKSPDSLFMVRIAQGLLHLGKGTLTLSPFNVERSIISKVSVASLLTISVLMLNPKSFILSDSTTETTHQLLYYLIPAVKPRMLITVDEELNPLKVNVRVGQAVDVVGQAGKPKTITGWVTQSTPVLLNHGERAELENTDEWISLSHSLEGVVILKKNPEFMEVDL